MTPCPWPPCPWPPCPWGEGGHLDLLWFPRHPNMCQSLSVGIRLCQTLFMQYFLHFFDNGFHIFRYGDHWQDLELIKFL